MTDKPAILGGEAVFREMIPINRPTTLGFDLMAEEYRGIIDSGMLTNHIYVRRFEEKIKEYLGVRNAVCVSCATAGLMLVEKCLDLKGEVIVPSFTFPATTHSLVWNNLKPVFVDCDPESFNIDVRKIEEKITDKTSAILGVYIFGNPLAMDALSELAKKRNLKLIFDSAHALGSTYEGRFAGNFGDAEVFSLAPTKIISSGEGGIITTNNDELAKKLKLARNYGSSGDYNCKIIGLNARMSELHALLGLKSMDILEENIIRRQELAELYKERLEKIPGLSFQKIETENRTTFNYFSILVDEDKFGLTNRILYQALDKENMMVRIYFFPPVHRQDAYSEYYEEYKDELLNTDLVCDKILCLPFFSHMEKGIIIKVCDSIERIYAHRERIQKRMIKNGQL